MKPTHTGKTKQLIKGEIISELFQMCAANDFACPTVVEALVYPEMGYSENACYNT